MDPTQQSEPVRLDGRRLEGGGQLVRIAVALSALTGRAVTIDHIRGNRSGKQGLKASHLAAIKTLAELSGSKLVKAQVGSCSVGFYPPPCEQGQTPTCQTDSEINIRLPTPGSVFLVFQALYPYLLHSASADRIRVSIIGGTNVLSSPSYDYVSQVLIPNFARVGLPPISIRLEERGWASGGGQHMGLGKVVMAVDTLRSLRRGNGGSLSHKSASIDLHQCQRGVISKIDITILATDDRLDEPNREAQNTKGNSKSRFSKHGIPQHASSEECDKPETVRAFMERYTHKSLRKRLRELPQPVFPHSSSEETDLELVPIQTHTTEATHRRSCLYVLIVGHTSTGFRIGRDALFGSLKERPKPKKRQNKPREDMTSRVKGLVDECVEHFIRELYDPLLQVQPDNPGTGALQPCVDEYMRDQLVVFEALARVSGDTRQQDVEGREDEKYWSLHTKTAQWVCREMLGENRSLGRKMK